MNIVSGVVLYVIIWWTVIFAVLPWGVRRSEEPERGHEVGAPERPRILLKVMVTTAISAVLWTIAYVVITGPWLSLRPPV